MWNVESRYLCRNHLLGEHVEMHTFVGCIRKFIRLDGYISKGLVEIHNIVKRHDELAKEMKRRGIQHNSPLVCSRLWEAGKVDVKKSEEILRGRCKKCFRNGGNSAHRQTVDN